MHIPNPPMRVVLIYGNIIYFVAYIKLYTAPIFKTFFLFFYLAYSLFYFIFIILYRYNFLYVFYGFKRGTPLEKKLCCHLKILPVNFHRHIVIKRRMKPAVIIFIYILIYSDTSVFNSIVACRIDIFILYSPPKLYSAINFPIVFHS